MSMPFIDNLRLGSIRKTSSRKLGCRSRAKTFHLERLEDRQLLAATIFRVNAGGDPVSATPNWQADSFVAPSPYVNAAATGNQTYNPGTTIDVSDPSVPPGTPPAIFQSERYDPGDGPELQWDFPVTPGNYRVQLYFAETYSGIQGIGQRVFDVAIEGTTVLNDYDVFAAVGANKGVMVSFIVNSDANLDIDFDHVVENPAIKAIEIIAIDAISPPLAVDDDLVNTTAGTSVTFNVLDGSQSSGGIADSDSDGTLVPATVTVTGSGVANGTLINNFDGTFVYTPDSNFSGVDSFTYTVSDNDGLTSNPATVTITVSAVASEVLYRVNAGGDLVSATPNWQADSFVAPSPYVNAAATGNQTYNPGTTIDVSDPSVPPGTPPAIFKSERWDPPGGAELQWDFPVTPGNYRVQLYFAETYSGIQGIGQRVFDVAIEGTTVLNDYDVFAAVGANTGVMVSFTVNSDANLDIDFDHVVENPAIKAIEIIAIDAISPPLAVDDDLVNTTAGTSVTFNVLDGSQSSGGIADSDSDGTLVPATVTVTGSGVANGTLINNFDGTFVYTPDSNFSGVDSFTYTVSDNDGLTSNPATVTITVSAVASEVLYRVNAGGDLVSATPNWQADSFVTPSPYVNAVATGNQTFNPGTTIDVSDPSVPPGTPPAIFQSERYDPGDGPELQWDFPVTPGNYRVQLYFAETYSGIQGIGQRVFDVAIEGITVLNDYDVFAAVGANKGVMVSFIVNSDANLDIDFDHVVENPAIKAIEIIAIDTAGGLGSPVDAVDFGPVTINSTSTRQVSLLNYGGPGDPDITITGVNVVGGNGAFAATVETGLPVVVPAGGSTSITVNFTPNALDEFSATLNVSHSGLNDPFSIPLLGGTIEQPIAFQKSVLANVSPYKPTSLQFGPDGRLYVAQQDGAINAYTITRNGPQSYDVTNIEVINLVKNIVNHDDNGVVNNTVNERLITGILVIGTAQNPIMYVTSSDPRIGAGDSGTDLNLDTNSGMVSRLTWNGESWDKLDLVRGLPRSEENHGTNGLQIDLATNTLYVAIGGNTNMGAPSKNFALLPEYALSAAILSIDLNTIGETTYDLPTLDDEDNPGADENDPFGGNDGKNQAILVPGGPVQVYAPGFRNPYDLLITSQGRMYTVDNGPNGGWGGVPIGEGPAGNATNDPSEPGTTFGDGLHFISAPGYYGGHPNPTRSNPGNTFNASNPQSPVTIGNPIESDYQAPQPNPQGYNLDGSLVSFPVSTGGLEEYTATNFGGQLQRQLLLTSFDNTIKRIELNAAGDVVLATAKLFSSVGGGPLDVTAQGDDEIFPGTIWVADYLADTIVVFEPIESSVGCPDDDDCDGYTNADEIANGTAPNNPGDVPADWDQDFISDLLDPDDDNDSQPDTSDRFAVDSANGSNTPIGTLYTWENNEMTGGLLSLGFTGLMSNAVDNYKTLFDPGALTAGGAAGVLTLDAATTGTALGAANSQQQALQFGFDAAAAVTPFTAYTSLLSPFAGLTPNLGEQAGLFLGTGDQDNYVQIVVVGTASGQIELQVISEVDGTASTVATSPAVSATNVDFIELFLQLDPTTDIMQASFQITRDGTAEGRTPLGPAIATPSDWTNDSMAVGIISTDPSPQSAVPFTWDFLGVVSAIPDDSPPQVDAGSDATINGLSVAQSLNANVIDSSNNGIALRTVWNLVSGPATVSFADPYAIETDVSFTAPGVYVLRLTADNGAAVVEDDVTITVLDDTRGLITSLQVVDPANGQGFGTLSPSPLEPGDILWPPISITADQVNNFAGSADGTTGSTATGSASFFYDASTNLLNYSITYQNLTADLTNIHIHGPANTGQSSAAHIFEVFSSTADVISAGVNRRSDTIVGAVNLTSHTHGGAHSTPTLAEALAALSTGQAYINVHSEAFPMGEIRGNVSAAVAAAEPFFDLGTLNTTTLRFEPSFTGDVASVSYSLDGVVVDTDNLPGDGFTWAGTSGDHNLVVTAYSDPNASGVAGPAYAVQFGVRVATNQQTRLAEWQTLAKAPYAQFEGQGAAVNGKIYLFGGFFTGSLNVTTQGAVYDPVNDIWTSIADSPVPLTHASHAVDGDKIYVVGGYVGDHPGGSTDQVWIYDTVSDGWTAGPRLPADRGGGGAAILGRRLYYFGGATRDQGNASSATDQPHTWSLDLGASDSVIDDGVWTRLADLPSPRNHMAGAAVGPFVYALGGQFGDNESNGNSNLVHRYDPTVNAWTQVASLPLEIGHISASTFTSNGRIFVVTGVTQDSTSTDTIFMYDPATDTWTALPPAPAAAQSPLSVTINGQIYIIGGDEENIGQTDNTYALDLNESWFNLPSMPVALGEVAGGIIGQTLYLVGEGSDATLAYDLGTGQWKSVNDLARRLYAGNHHAAETIDGKLYLFGGLGDGSDGKVQIYDPLTDSWSLGANVPFSIGSAATALIAGKVYLAGGIIGSATTNQAAVYDPAADTWTSIASMPEGVNHAAAATDGARFYLFGGRTGGNVVGDGFDYVQVYDPATGVWNSSTQGILAPLPESRGGTGRAVYLNNEFYIFGGETSNSPVATPAGTYDRVDIYNPTTNAWRLGVPMPTARHGIFPVEHAGVIYLAGGGMNSGFGQSNLMQAYYADVVSAASEASPARNPYDTNGDGGVTTLDALVVINALSQLQIDSSEKGASTLRSLSRLDANRDGKVTALDALVVINHLARQTRSIEPVTIERDQSGWAMATDRALQTLDTDDDAEERLWLLLADDQRGLHTNIF